MGILDGIARGIGGAADAAASTADEQIKSQIDLQRQQALAEFTNHLTQGNMQMQHDLGEQSADSQVDRNVKQAGLLHDQDIANNKEMAANVDNLMQPKLMTIAQKNASANGGSPDDPKNAPTDLQKTYARLEAAAESGLSQDKILSAYEKTGNAEATLALKQAQLVMQGELTDAKVRMFEANAQRYATMAASGALKKSDAELYQSLATDVARDKATGKDPDPAKVATLTFLDKKVGSKAADTESDYEYDKAGNVTKKVTTKITPGVKTNPTPAAPNIDALFPLKK